MLATLCVLGCFNRPTFVIFAVPIVCVWLLRGIGTRAISIVDFARRAAYLALYSLPCLAVCIIIDSVYYGYLTAPDIRAMQLGIDKFVVTPINLVRYNIDPDNTGQHGIHPRYSHLLVTIPLLYNILGAIAIGSMVGHILFR